MKLNKLLRDAKHRFYNTYLALTNPIAMSVAAALIDRATFVKYCLNSEAHDCSSIKNCGEWVYQTDAIRIIISALSKRSNSTVNNR